MCNHYLLSYHVGGANPGETPGEEKVARLQQQLQSGKVVFILAFFFRLIALPALFCYFL